MMVTIFIVFACCIFYNDASPECITMSSRYKKDKPFTSCINVYAGHDIYFVQNCPIPAPRLCIEPIPEGVNFHVAKMKRQPRTDET